MGLSTNGEISNIDQRLNMVEDTINKTAQIPPWTCVPFDNQLKDEDKCELPANGLDSAPELNISQQTPALISVQSNKELEDEARKMRLENGLDSVPEEIRTYFRLRKPPCKCGSEDTKFLRFNNPIHCKHIQPWYSCNAGCKPFRLFSRYKQEDVIGFSDVKKKKQKTKHVRVTDGYWVNDCVDEDQVNIPTPLLPKKRIRLMANNVRSTSPKEDQVFPTDANCEEYPLQYSNMEMSTMNANDVYNQIQFYYPNIHTQMTAIPYQHQMVATLNQQIPNNNFNCNNHIYSVQPLNQSFSNVDYNNLLSQEMFQTFLPGNGSTVMSIGGTIQPQRPQHNCNNNMINGAALQQQGMNGCVVSSVPQMHQYSSFPNQGPQVNNFQVKKEANDSNSQLLAQNSTTAAYKHVNDRESLDPSISNSFWPDLATGSYQNTT